VYHSPSYILLTAFILLFCFAVMATSPDANIAFNVNFVGASYDVYRTDCGMADNWYYSYYDNYPCIVYVYYETWGTRYVYVKDGIVLYVTR
jgi:hypothetical protein